MSRVRRTRYVAFSCRDARTVDLEKILEGQIELVATSEVRARSVLTEGEQSLSADAFAVAASIPEEWVSSAEFPQEQLADLARKGVLVTDDPDPELAELRRRDELLSAEQWSPDSAVYHFTTKWRDVRVDLGPDPRHGANLGELLDSVIAEFGRYAAAPSHFVSHPDAKDVLRLPDAADCGAISETLLRRRTSRAFDRDARLTREQLATVLHYVWGCQGIARLGDELALVKKTSPSGGGLHPIEVYPLVRNVDGVDPGLYHYRVKDHALELISALERDEAEELAVELTAGQTYFRSAHALFLMTARFHRNFWKYREHSRAYTVVLMDAAHLSQTLYLVCAELGLGAFVTAAINAGNIEDRLRLDGYREGAIAVCGCGPPTAPEPGLEPVFEPYSR